jgi:hypothetical protein
MKGKREMQGRKSTEEGYGRKGMEGRKEGRGGRGDEEA